MDAPVFAGPIGLLLLTVAIAWGVLMFFAPFFWYGAWYRAKQIHAEAAHIRKLLEQQVGELNSAAPISEEYRPEA